MLISFLAVSLDDRWRDANPIRVVELTHQLGWGGGVIILAGSVLILASGYFLLAALQVLQPNSGWLVLFCWWTGVFYVLTFVLRWLGVFCHHRFRQDRRRGG